MLYAFCARAQDAIKLNLELKSGDKKAFKNIVYKPVLSDSIELSKELNQIIIQLNKQSYLAANGDLLQLQSDSFLFQINIGNSFKALFVKSDNTSD